MFKVIFEWLQYYPDGSQPKVKAKIRLFDANTGEELERKIQQEIESDDCGYQKHKRVREITRL